MEAVGRIYAPFLGRDSVSHRDTRVLEGLLKNAGFSSWTTTEHPLRIYFSYGGRDSLENERCMQGYGEFEEMGLLKRYRVFAEGRELIDFMERLNPQEL